MMSQQYTVDYFSYHFEIAGIKIEVQVPRFSLCRRHLAGKMCTIHIRIATNYALHPVTSSEETFKFASHCMGYIISTV
jgi:hypothetical protein